jgi:hypothetical protein
MWGIIEKCTLDKITKQLFDDIECCLINSNQPICNTMCKDSYKGREIKIINDGDYSPLKKESICSEKK